MLQRPIQTPSPITIKRPIPLGLDLGFAGVAIPGLKPILPNKKPRGRELSDAQKSQNKTLAKLRVKVENAICGVKRSHAVADTYRNISGGFDELLMSVACGLHNVRVAYRYQRV